MPKSQIEGPVKSQVVKQQNKRNPIMPNETRPKKGSKSNSASHPQIMIAQAEMTLTGFEHNAQVLKKKRRQKVKA